jgi:SecD/SecF fusion protein
MKKLLYIFLALALLDCSPKKEVPKEEVPNEEGIKLTIQISVKDILKSLSNNSTDPIFNQALIDAEEKQKNSQDTYIEDFFVAFDAIKGDTKLASTDIFANRDLREEITFDMSDEDVQPIIKQKIDQSIVATFEVLRKRIDKFGITQPNIQRLGNSGRILVELPGAKDIDRVKKLLQSTAQLEFWHALRGEDFINFIVQANEVVKSIEDTQKVSTTSDSTNNEIDDLLGTASESTFVEPNPISFVDYGYAGGPIVGIFEAKDQQRISDYLKMPEVRSLLSTEQRYAKFVWGIPKLDLEGNELVGLYVLQGNRDNKPELSGSVVVDASQQMDIRNEPAVSMQMNVEGSKTWEKMTGIAYTNGRKGASRSQIAIVLDETVYSAPGVTTGPISGGISEITGSFTVAEAQDLANVLMAGKLPASVNIIQSEIY